MTNKNQSKDTLFSGEHFQYMGNMWNSLLGDGGNLFIYLREGVEKGTMIFNTLCNGTEEAQLIAHPEEKTEIPVLYTLGPTDEGYTFISAATLLNGIKTNMILTDMFTWDNKLEGSFAGITKGNPRILNFYNPLFMRDKDLFAPSKDYEVSLSAIALHMELLKEETLRFSEGAGYEHDLAEFLKKNPGKTKKDFPYTELHIGKQLRMFYTRGVVGEYETVGEIEAIESTSIFDTPIQILRVNFGHKGEDDFILNLYTSYFARGEYMPKVGDIIHTNLWLMGYILPLPAEAEF